VPRVTFLPANETFEFESGKLPYKDHGKPESLLDIAMNNGFGDANLSEMEDDEADRVEQAAGVELRSRLGCQAVVKGDVTVLIPEWNRNYVSEGH
jgi:2Fe-2S ferredoxin